MAKNDFDNLDPRDKREYLAWLAEDGAREKLTPKAKKLLLMGTKAKTKSAWFPFN
jgi:hypothetical protein